MGLGRLRIPVRVLLPLAMVEVSECVERFSLETLAVSNCTVFLGKEIAATFPVSTRTTSKKQECTKAGSATPRFCMGGLGASGKASWVGGLFARS